jgi:hypothetical protein
MAIKFDPHKLLKIIFGFSNACISTIAFTLIFFSLIFYYFDFLNVAQEANFILIMLAIFALDQLFIKPVFSRIENRIN